MQWKMKRAVFLVIYIRTFLSPAGLEFITLLQEPKVSLLRPMCVYIMCQEAGGVRRSIVYLEAPHKQGDQNPQFHQSKFDT